MASEKANSAVAGLATRLFLRDDDVGDLNGPLQTFVELFLDRKLPISYQIIPEKLTAECARFLLAMREANPGLIEFGQHGLRHQMTVRGRQEFYEFGPERSYHEQRADIRKGKDLLRQRLGDDSAAFVFTPPRHRYDRNTLRALRDESFSVLSSSAYTDPAHQAAYSIGRALGLSNIGRGGVARHGQVRPDCGLYELSVAVALDDGSTIARSVEASMALVGTARRVTDVVGLMFHHQAYGSPSGRAFLERLADGLGALPGATFHRISELARGARPLASANGDPPPE